MNLLENILLKKLNKRDLISTILELNENIITLREENKRINKRLSHNTDRVKSLKEEIETLQNKQ